MRKRLTLTVALVVLATVGVAATASAILTAPDGNTQSIALKIKPSRLPRSTPVPVTLEVTTQTFSVTNPFRLPVPAVKAIIDFDAGVTLFTKGYPTCNTGKIVNTSTEAAMRACKPAKIGGGWAKALLRVGSTVFNENLTVTAFNGKPQGRKPVVLLHSYGRAPVETTAVLVGVVSNYDKRGYGPRLSVNIPLIAGGTGALTEFHTGIFKKFRYKGRQRSYVTSTCRNGTLKGRGQFVFRDGESLTPTVTQRCQKK